MVYIKYKRIADIFNSEMLQEKLDSFIVEGWEIIYYNEKIMEKTQTDERIFVTIVVGKPNEGVGRTKTMLSTLND